MDDEAFEKMEAFINGEMNVDERLQFEKRLSGDPVLRRQLELYLHVQDTLTHSIQNKEQEEKLKQGLAMAYREHIEMPAVRTPVRNMRKWYYIAAAVFLVAIFIIFIPKNKNGDAQSLYAEYAVFPALSNIRGAGDTLLAAASGYYNKGHFMEAVTAFNKALARDTGNIEVRFDIYLAYLQNNDLPEALRGFTRVAGYENVYKSQAQWYAALTYLKLGDIAACKKILLGISGDADTYTKAQQLLSDLK